MRVVGSPFVVELPDLGGRERIADLGIIHDCI